MKFENDLHIIIYLLVKIRVVSKLYHKTTILILLCSGRTSHSCIRPRGLISIGKVNSVEKKHINISKTWRLIFSKYILMHNYYNILDSQYISIFLKYSILPVTNILM